MKRKIIEIDEAKCTGCGECVPACPEGALQVIDRKARLISDLFCDGLGACIGSCPVDAIKIIERDAEPYDERKTMQNIIKSGKNTVIAHLKHLKEHGETQYLKQALEILKEKHIEIDPSEILASTCCPGMKIIDAKEEKEQVEIDVKIKSQLKQWPIQLRLVNTMAPYFEKADLLFAADCTSYAYGNFHNDFMKGKTIVIACPKLDSETDGYVEKISQIIANNGINTATVVIMEVPCCSGLLRIVEEGIRKAGKKIPLKKVVISLKGKILTEEWL
ncbi:MAG: 4Fe-4S binding protein [Candidatus Omnitrophica bacterium]|nr:4Fe-4S binding protein [Candidatus Omnitrophota bacterium]MCM8817071.1 4Fe-4S binding protein [Candidatus Omnitrophota bacterium]